MQTNKYTLTYSTMFDPPEELHLQFKDALKALKAKLGKEHGMLIAGKDRFAAEKFEKYSPADTTELLGVFQKGTEQHANEALVAARQAFRQWSSTKWQDRVTLLRKAAEIIDNRIFEMGAVMSLEVGKNRMESLGEIAETADLIRYACDQMEKNNGYRVEMGRDPLTDYVSTNQSVMKPYGVWLVISPFNFPVALTGGPVGAALVTGNTVVMKPATDTPWSVRLLAECLQESGLPDGVFNYVTGPGQTLGQTLIESPEVDGVTFTGSYDVGMKIHREFAKGRHIRPTILELGGKNPVIVSRYANLEHASMGVARSAFGLQGQKCSAASRVYVEAPVYEEFLSLLVQITNKLIIGNPTSRNTYIGPVINQCAYQNFVDFSQELSQAGEIITGGKALTEGDYKHGFFCSPTIVTDLPVEHRLWKHEMFLPIIAVAKVNNLDKAMKMANEVDYGLTAGFYGSEAETEWFFDQIEAGTVYANRPQGATTGAWPGFQPFGGWKGSGSTGKNVGGHYYLPLYMHEQSRTRVVS